MENAIRALDVLCLLLLPDRLVYVPGFAARVWTSLTPPKKYAVSIATKRQLPTDVDFSTISL